MMPPAHKRINGFIVDSDLAFAQERCFALAQNDTFRLNLEPYRNISHCKTLLKESPANVILLGVPEVCETTLETISQVQAINPSIAIIVLAERLDARAADECITRGAQACHLKTHGDCDSLALTINLAARRQELLCDLTKREAKLKARIHQYEENSESNHQFIQTAAHDFRSPLTVITEFASLLIEGLVGDSPLDEKQKHFLRVISDRTDELNTIVGNLLDATKLESHSLSLWRRPCKLPDLLDLIEATLKNKATVRNVDLAFDVAPSLPPLFADEDSVGRLLSNLLSTMILSCDPAGIVKLSATEDELNRNLVITVTNVQSEIDRDLEDTINAGLSHQTPRCKCKGIALSLRIASEITRHNFGQLQRESLPNRGTQIILTLPLVNADELIKRFKRTLSDNTPLAVIEIKDPDGDCKSSEESTALLQLTLNHDEVLIPVSANRWVLLSPQHCHATAMKDPITAYRERTNSLLNEINEHRTDKLSLNFQLTLRRGPSTQAIQPNPIPHSTLIGPAVTDGQAQLSDGNLNCTI